MKSKKAQTSLASIDYIDNTGNMTKMTKAAATTKPLAPSWHLNFICFLDILFESYIHN